MMKDGTQGAENALIERVYEAFEILPDWRVTGSADDSGMTHFEGVIDSSGSFTTNYLRLGGTISGTVKADGTLTG